MTRPPDIADRLLLLADSLLALVAANLALLRAEAHASLRWALVFCTFGVAAALAGATAGALALLGAWYFLIAAGQSPAHAATVLALVAGVVAALCVVLAGLAYRRMTRIGRRTALDVAALGKALRGE